MQRLRHARFLARLALVWFALTLGAAIASPMVRPQPLDVVCTGAGGVKLLAPGDDGAIALSHHALDCPLCASTGAPPPVVKLSGPAALPLSKAVASIPAARVAALVAPALPARGPPSSPPVQ